MRHKESCQYPHSEFPLRSSEQISRFIGDKLSSRKPASIIRLGDGEGAILARPTAKDSTLWATVVAHFGPGVTAGFINSLADQLTCAIDTADVIGIRDDLLHVDFPESNFELGENEFTEQFRALFKLRPVEKTIAYPGALRLALMHRFLVNHRFQNGVLFGSAWMHFALSQSVDLARLISKEQHIALVSSKVALAQQLQSLLKVKVKYFKIPDIYHKLKNNKSHDFANQLPDTLAHMMDALKVGFQGQLFLVGAGIFGKIYCHRIKELGGVAVDIGSVCDAWLGIPSRPLVFQSLFGGSDNRVPEALLLKHQAENL